MFTTDQRQFSGVASEIKWRRGTCLQKQRNMCPILKGGDTKLNRTDEVTLDKILQ